MLRIWETQVTASKVTVEIYMMRVIIWQLLMLYFIHKGKGRRKVWGTWIPFLTQIRAAEAEVGIKTSPLLIYNVIGRTRLYLQPRAVFTTFFFFFPLLALFLKRLWLPTFYALLECNNNCGIISSEFVFLPEIRPALRPRQALAGFCLRWVSWVNSFSPSLLSDLWNSSLWSLEFCNSLSTALWKMQSRVVYLGPTQARKRIQSVVKCPLNFQSCVNTSHTPLSAGQVGKIKPFLFCRSCCPLEMFWALLEPAGRFLDIPRDGNVFLAGGAKQCQSLTKIYKTQNWAGRGWVWGLYFYFRILINTLNKVVLFVFWNAVCLRSCSRDTGAAAQGSFKSDTHVCKVFNILFLGQSVREFKLLNWLY